MLCLGLTVAYFCADFLLNRFAFNDGWTIMWPLNGVTIALLLMKPRKGWPAILLAVAVGTGVAEYFNHNSFWFEIGQRFISLAEVFISAWLLPPFYTFETWMRSRLIVYRFLAALFLGPGISGLMAAVQFHFAQGQPYLTAFNNWATADALGIAATMPLVLSLRSPEMWELFSSKHLARTLSILFMALSASCVLLSVSRYPLLFLLFPLLLAVESLLAFAGTVIVAFGVSVIAVYMATHGHGPFGSWPPGLEVPRGAALQIYIGFNLVALFPASILTLERRRMSAELVKANTQLLMLASIDGLTEIANRRTLDERFLKEWKRAIRTQTPLALLMVDIDHFKQFNDMNGHHAGDRCLKTVAHVLQRSLRRPHDLAARFGGEEFALLLPHTSLEDACALAEKVRKDIADLELIHTGSPRGCVTISIGCSADTPSPGDNHLRLLESADSALYSAKQAGRNCVQVGELTSVLM